MIYAALIPMLLLMSCSPAEIKLAEEVIEVELEKKPPHLGP